MKQVLFMFTATATILFFSCKEKKVVTEKNPVDATTLTDNYKTIGQSKIDSFNIQLKGKSISTVEEIMRLYFPEEQHTEGKYTYIIRKQESSNGEIIVTLVSEGIPDDAVFGTKIIMVLKNENGNYRVISVKESYKCWPDRGHENWTASPC